MQCLLCGNRFASVKNMIKHQEKAHADEVRQHKERARAGEQRVSSSSSFLVLSYILKRKQTNTEKQEQTNIKQVVVEAFFFITSQNALRPSLSISSTVL